MANGNNNKGQLSIAEVFGEKSKDGDDIVNVLKKLLSAPGNWLSTPYGGELQEVEKEMPSYEDRDAYMEYIENEAAGRKNVDYLRKGKYQNELPSFPYITQTPLSRGNIPGGSWSRGDEIMNVLMSLILGGGAGFAGKQFASSPHKGRKSIK